MSKPYALPKDLDAIYVIHAKTGYEAQGVRVVQLFDEMQLPFEFVSEGDIAHFTDEILAHYFTSDIFEKLRRGSVSLSLNHLMCLERMVKLSQPLVLIFEDDPCFLGDFVSDISRVVQEAKKLPPGFIISLENSGLVFPPRKSLREGQYLYPAKATRCAGAYLIDLQGAKNALARIESHKCGLIIDWWYNELIDNDLLEVYWAHPPLTEQGSHNGLLSSTISTQSNSYWRRFSWLAHKYYKQVRWWLTT